MSRVSFCQWNQIQVWVISAFLWLFKTYCSRVHLLVPLFGLSFAKERLCEKDTEVKYITIEIYIYLFIYFLDGFAWLHLAVNLCIYRIGSCHFFKMTLKKKVPSSVLYHWHFILFLWVAHITRLHNIYIKYEHRLSWAYRIFIMKDYVKSSNRRNKAHMEMRVKITHRF